MRPDAALRIPGHQPLIVGDLKLFEPKARCPLTAVRDREER
jgi:hypothetical protein